MFREVVKTQGMCYATHTAACNQWHADTGIDVDWDETEMRVELVNLRRYAEMMLAYWTRAPQMVKYVIWHELVKRPTRG